MTREIPKETHKLTYKDQTRRAHATSDSNKGKTRQHLFDASQVLSPRPRVRSEEVSVPCWSDSCLNKFQRSLDTCGSRHNLAPFDFHDGLDLLSFLRLINS